MNIPHNIATKFVDSEEHELILGDPDSIIRDRVVLEQVDGKWVCTTYLRPGFQLTKDTVEAILIKLNSLV